MKIAIYSDNFYPEMSGISDSIILIAKGLAQKNHLINFYVPRYSKNDYLVSKLTPEELKLGENIKIIRLPSIPYPMAPTKQGRFALPVLSSLKSIKKFKPDIIYTQDFFSAGMEALVVSKICSVPLIGTSHTPITEFLKYAPISVRLLSKLILHYVSWYYNRCIFVSAPSGSILDEMKSYGFKKMHEVISNPIDLSGFSPAIDEETKKSLKKKFGLTSRVAIYTGRLGEEKRVDDIIRAIGIVKKEFSDINLAITGHGNAEESLKKLTKELGLEKNIFFFGYVDPSMFKLLYQAADIFTVMSTAETQCMSMMQAMATKIPVIGARAWGLAEYINEKNGYLVEPGDYAGLASKIIYLFKNPEILRRLGEGGSKYVTNFSQEHISQKWEDIFKSYAIL